MYKRKKIDPRVKRTTKYLRDAFIDLLEEKDLDMISIKDITDRAELTRGTFYLHYDDKYDFLSKIINETLEDLIKNVKSNQTSEDNPKISFINLFEYIAQNHNFFRVMLSDKGLREFRTRMLEIVQEKVYGNLLSVILNSDEDLIVPKDIFISYVISAHIGVISSWLENGMKYSPLFMATTLTKLTLEGPIQVIGLQHKVKF